MLSVNDQASWWPHMRWEPFFLIIILEERERKRKEQACTAWHDSWCNDGNLRWRWWHFGIIWPYMLLFLRGFKCLIIHLWLLPLFFHGPCAAHMFFFSFFFTDFFRFCFYIRTYQSPPLHEKKNHTLQSSTPLWVKQKSAGTNKLNISWIGLSPGGIWTWVKKVINPSSLVKIPTQL